MHNWNAKINVYQKWSVNFFRIQNIVYRIFVMKLTINQWWSERCHQLGRACSITWRRPRDHMTSINTSTTSSPRPRQGGRSLKRRWSFARQRRGKGETDLNHSSTVWQTSRPGWVNSTAQFMRSFLSGFHQRHPMKSSLTTEQHSGWGKIYFQY